jgi:hypothetical protein
VTTQTSRQPRLAEIDAPAASREQTPLPQRRPLHPLLRGYGGEALAKPLEQMLRDTERPARGWHLRDPPARLLRLLCEVARPRDTAVVLFRTDIVCRAARGEEWQFLALSGLPACPFVSLLMDAKRTSRLSGKVLVGAARLERSVALELRPAAQRETGLVIGALRSRQRRFATPFV